jgi:hypothetical protein
MRKAESKIRVLLHITTADGEILLREAPCWTVRVLLIWKQKGPDPLKTIQKTSMQKTSGI